MSEGVGTCLAITEKRSYGHRPGGCVGIFFQLFDWNRRFAKKKIFSKKLIPPAPAKQVLKKLGEDEKMSKGKVHLIADENNGRCSVKSEHKQELQAPSLVARLMGLESMPDSGPHKHKKGLLPDRCDDGEVEIVENCSGDDKEDLKLGKGNGKVESRSQKLQKTRASERLTVARFGGDGLQIKNVLSRSRKHEHSKLASPVKTPKFPSGKNSTRTSRLIDVAAKLLEPGLQSSNKAKCALTYSSSMHFSPKDEVKKAGKKVLSPELLNHSSYDGCEDNSLMGQSSCTNCGNLLGVAHPRSNEEEKPYYSASSASNFVDTSSKGLGMSKPNTPKSSIEQDTKVISRKSQYQSVHLASQVKDNLQTGIKTFRDGKSLSKANPERWPLSGQPCKLQKADTISRPHKLRTQAQYQISPGKGRISTGASANNLQSKNASSAANAVNGSNLRSSSTFGKQWNPRCDASTRKERGPNTQSLDRSCIKRKSVVQGKGSKTNVNKDCDIISFTFNSPLRNKSEISTEAEEKRSNQYDIVANSISPTRKLVLDENVEKTSLWKTLPFNGDALGAFLEQNLKELTTFQEEDDLGAGDTVPKRSTALILQELISALTTEYPISPDVDGLSLGIAAQAKGKLQTSLVGFSHDVDHPSPGSVLGASFSNDSWVSSSLDDGSGLKQRLDSLHYSYDQAQPSKPNVDLLDSATSLNKPGTAILTDLINHISCVFQSVNLAGPSLIGQDLTHAEEIVLIAELLFGYASQHSPHGILDFLTDPLFLDKLETLARATCPNYTHSQSSEETKEDQMRGFLFDCVIECLDSKYARYSQCGYKAWRRLPLCLNKEFMIREVDNEVRSWTHLAGKSPDEIIDCEMSHSIGRWTEFNIEAYEAGAEIDRDILDVLVEEIAVDILF